MPGSATPYGYCISRSSKDDSYGLWTFHPEGREILKRVELKPGASLPGDDKVISIGGYLLTWSAARPAQGAPYFEFRLLPFDPGSKDPLSVPPLQHGQWSQRKFWGRSPDFSNPTGGHKQYDTDDDLELIPLGTFLLNFIPTDGRGTYGLWNFDPCPTAPGTADPVPGDYPFTAQGSFRDMQLGDELIPLNGYVLDRRRKTGEYRLWSFDPQARDPLAYPAIQRGKWEKLGASHELVAIGDYVLDWVPKDRSYRLWRFDPKSPEVLTGPVQHGKLPTGINAHSALMGFQPNRPASAAPAKVPGTVDFMRSKIKHVVYYMIENRSFDHVVGWLHSAQEKGLNVIGPKGPYNGASTRFSNHDPATKQDVHLSKYKGGKLSNDWDLEMFSFDPYHDLSDVLRQYFYKNRNGYAERAVPDMGGFVWNNSSDQVMQTYTPEQLPVLNGLAAEYAISDEWFCSIPSSTDANRAFALTGSSMLEANNFMTPPQYNYWPEQPHRPSVFKLLWTNGFTDWKLYHSTVWQKQVFTYQLFLEGQIPTVDANLANYVEPIEQFYADALAGKLPAFSYLEPVWIASNGTSSYHPGADLVPAEEQLNRIYDSIRKGPGWEETLLIVTFDEHGGIYDHVAPPYAENPWPNDLNNGFKYDLLGPRVPTILVSPFIEPKTVFRSETPVVYDSTSILATLLHWAGIPKARWFLGERTNHASTFEAVLSRATPRETSPAFKPPYDKAYPQSGERNPSTIVTDLPAQMAHQRIVAMAHGKLSSAEISKLSHEVAGTETDITKLSQRLDELAKRFG